MKGLLKYKRVLVLIAFVGFLCVGFCYIFLKKERMMTVQSLDDGRVYDCVTQELRGSGAPGVVRTTEFKNSTVWESKEILEERSEIQASFVKIFKEQKWGGVRQKPLEASGPGSALLYTFEAMAGLHLVITELKTHLRKDRISMLDIPCGDMRWMPRFLESRDDVDYTGMDIVPELIAAHKKNFASKSWTFINRDIINDGLMGARYDLVFSRQMLQHLLNHDVMKFLHEISQSGSGYILTTSFPMTERNVELDPGMHGRFRFLNLEAPPMSLGPPICYFRDGPNPNQKHALMLYKLPLRQVVNCKNASKMKTTKSVTKLDTYYACGNWSI